MAEKTTKYRPSNGSEGEWFRSLWCDRCIKDQFDKPCSILSRSLTRPDYPTQWVEDDDGPRCTAFADHKAPKPTTIKDKRQIGMQL